MSLVVVSPHLDDAVFSCGTLIAATALRQPVTILTVCAGVPRPAVQLVGGESLGYVTQLDMAAGFESSVDAMEVRREEDKAAADLLGAQVIHLDVLDGQYDRPDDPSRMTRISVALGLELRRYQAEAAQDVTVLSPVGIRHADHIAVAAVCASWATLRYEELPYRELWPEERPDGLGAPLLMLPSCPVKEQAILCYRSQLGDGPPGYELRAYERYHRGR